MAEVAGVDRANPEIGEIRSYQVLPDLGGTFSLSAHVRQTIGKYAFYRSVKSKK
jgi:hypothetical protein